MSLSTSDREFIKGAVLPTFFTLLMVILSAAIVLDLYHREVLDRLDDLCRAHYPECIVEQRGNE